jgi:hypothetical protein
MLSSPASVIVQQASCRSAFSAASTLAGGEERAQPLQIPLDHSRHLRRGASGRMRAAAGASRA